MPPIDQRGDRTGFTILLVLGLALSACKSVDSIDTFISSYVTRATAEMNAEPAATPAERSDLPEGEAVVDSESDEQEPDDLELDGDETDVEDLTVAVPASLPRRPVVPGRTRRAPVDPALVGAWEQSDGYADATSGFSGAVSVRLELRADGTFTRSSSAAAGLDNLSSLSDGEVTLGHWSAASGILRLVSDAGTYQVKYTFHDGSLVFGTKGNYSFWYSQ